MDENTNSEAENKVLETAKEALQDLETIIKSPTTYIKALEHIRLPLLELRCRVQRELFEKREQMRVPNFKADKDQPRLTDLDRSTMLNGYTAELNEKYELVRGLEELVKERVAIVKTLLEIK